MFVRLVNLAFSYSDSVPLLTEVDFQLSPGWTGVVGPNGAGKSTLLRLVAGELSPSSGHVQFVPPRPRVFICSQTAEARTDVIESFAAAQDRVSNRIRAELDLRSGDLARWPTLSPGERRRWQIGAGLAAEPAILMLDEPTDHLDADARQLLTAALARFSGVGIVVSHDRVLLDALTSYTVRVADGRATIWRGAYSAAKTSWEAEQRESLEQYARLKHQREVLRRRLADKRRQAASSQAVSLAGARMKGGRDHDATGMMAKGKARAASATISRQAGVIRSGLDRISGQLQSFRFDKPPGRALFVDYVPAPQTRVLTISVPALSAGGTLVLDDIHLCVSRQDRIHLAGPNGAGKTTLLKALIARASIPPSRLLYLPQELGSEDSAALLESLNHLSVSERARVLTLVAALGVEPDKLLATASPSPGEARKLKLAYGLGCQVWALALDEPTNHLDMPAIERLEDALAAYPGALILVTHDEALASRCTTTRWLIRDGHVVVQ